LRLALPFYLGLHAPGAWQQFPEGWVRSAAGLSPDLMYKLVMLYRGEREDGGVERLNFRCAKVTVSGSDEAFFVKAFPRHHALHDLERWLRCSRVDRAWRAAHLLPRLGVLTPKAVGTALMRGGDSGVVEYLATVWLEGAVPFPQMLSDLRGEARAQAVGEFAQAMRGWHARGIYLRDLVKNVLVTERGGVRRYWLTDLDGLHPFRRVNRRRLLHHMRQLRHWTGPLRPAEMQVICEAYLGRPRGKMAEMIREALGGE
jgi:hypothetical protein